MEKYNLKHYAHIGDAVWEIFIRRHAIDVSNTQKGLHLFTIKYVNANFQSEVLHILELKDSEKELVRRGLNLPLGVNKRNNQNVHRHATAFEVLIGYLYLNNRKRLDEIFEFLERNAIK